MNKNDFIISLKRTLMRIYRLDLFHFHDNKISIENILRVIYAVMVIDTVILLVFSYKINYSTNNLDKEVKFRVSPGKHFQQIADELEKEGVINNAFYFKIAAKLKNQDDKIISRTYIFKPGLNNNEVLDILTNPALHFTVKFTVLEGSTIRQIAKSVENKLNLDPDKFIAETKNDSLIAVLGLDTKIPSLEGFLYPDTYKVPLDITEKELVELLFSEFEKKVAGQNDVYSRNPVKLLKVITLASIVQGETQIDSEMPVIAGVYTNRLSKRMKLEADPTVQYALPDGPKARLMKSDLKVKSPYNTYLNYGLPPGPINNPGIKAIEAALSPEKNDFLFFVATGKGGHTFTKTYQEHLKAVEEYKKNVKQK
ncbi:MAG: endolytic transglycosylase MltG [Bacteroidetes bacterium]|nr:endolytic transglycosylase MltG [Bacteroidota bacterium]